MTPSSQAASRFSLPLLRPPSDPSGMHTQCTVSPTTQFLFRLPMRLVWSSITALSHREWAHNGPSGSLHALELVPAPGTPPYLGSLHRMWSLIWTCHQAASNRRLQALGQVRACRSISCSKSVSDGLRVWWALLAGSSTPAWEIPVIVVVTVVGTACLALLTWWRLRMVRMQGPCVTGNELIVIVFAHQVNDKRRLAPQAGKETTLLISDIEGSTGLYEVLEPVRGSCGCASCGGSVLAQPCPPIASPCAHTGGDQQSDEPASHNYAHCGGSTLRLWCACVFSYAALQLLTVPSCCTLQKLERRVTRSPLRSTARKMRCSLQ
jgi:hypothetical protein